MAVAVVPYQSAWPVQASQVIVELEAALVGVGVESIEHVGSTSVPGLAAKPVLDIDVIVTREHIGAAIDALTEIGYRHVGDRGIPGREALEAPDEDPRRHIYVCESGTLHVRNHLAARDILRDRSDLREEYAAVKLALAADPVMDIDTYIARKSAVLQRVLVESGLSQNERLQILRANDPDA
ncbi:MAG: GrpB family protein [Ornithinimicrobium sp.]